MVNIGIVGYGYWGPNLVRNFAETPGAKVAAVADLDTNKLAAVQRRFPAVKTTIDFRELLTDQGVDAIAIVTPVNTHFELALAALRAGKHVWVEKPMTETSDQAKQLIDEAQQRGLVLLVDHTFIYTGAVMKMAELIRSGELGRIYYYDSIRVNLGLFQRDVSVISDLAVHDFSILDHGVAVKPKWDSNIGHSKSRKRRDHTKWSARRPEHLASWRSPALPRLPKLHFQ
ncbi:MAG: Gfo/Idh/MocA family oxidoreductase [Rhizobacter sp.]|nr:Gfo/Idh/MocA family oxidoreductase [Rhizobacter sp.]